LFAVYGLPFTVRVIREYFTHITKLQTANRKPPGPGTVAAKKLLLRGDTQQGGKVFVYYLLFIIILTING
jgi:hypothetical protein